MPVGIAVETGDGGNEKHEHRERDEPQLAEERAPVEFRIAAEHHRKAEDEGGSINPLVVCGDWCATIFSRFNNPPPPVKDEKEHTKN